MHHYTLIAFNWNDDIITTVTLRAGGLPQAQRMADHIMQTHPGSAGYQLWCDGQRVHTTFPRQQNAGKIAILRGRQVGHA